MNESIIAALISAASSILVALISKGASNRRARRAPSESMRSTPPRAWIWTIALLAIWLVTSPGMFHHDLSGDNFFLIPVVLLVLALFRPIRPLAAAWVTLAVFSANFLLGPLSNRLAGSQYDTAFGLDAEGMTFLLVLSFASTAIIAAVCFLRLRSAHVPTDSPDPRPPDVSRGDETFTASLERLAALHDQGMLSDEEFRAAKKRILE